MDLSSQPSSDEDRILQRPLYRAGQANPSPAPKTPTPAPSRSTSKSASPPASAPSRKVVTKGGSSSSDKSSKGQRILVAILLLGFGYYLLYGTPTQRKRVYKGLAVAAWLLLLCGLSYAFFLPNLNAIEREQRAIFQDPNLTPQQKFEKARELTSKLTP